MTSTERVQDAVRKVRNFIFSEQTEAGYWHAPLNVDSTVVSDYVVFHAWSGTLDPIRAKQCRDHLFNRQLADGGWSQYPGGPAEVNATVKAYHALKILDVPTGSMEMVIARQKALNLGGIPAMHTYGKLYLALCGCFSWKNLPCIPAEIVLLPTWAPFHLYAVSSWTRNLLVPLAIINHFKPIRQHPNCPNLNEVFPDGSIKASHTRLRNSPIFSARNAFLLLDKVIRVLNVLPTQLIRQRSLRAAHKWILHRTGAGSDGLGAIFPAILNTLVALQCLRIDPTDPHYQKQLEHLESLVLHDAHGLRVLPCTSPVWDTAINLQALLESTSNPASQDLVRAADWILEREIKTPGDWKMTNPEPEPSGWAFEFNNPHYPDIDDTFQVILSLLPAHSSNPGERGAAIHRSLAWARSFQCRNGGFAAFDKDVTNPLLEEIPFADHNAILDPPCADITGRALETFAAAGIDPNDPSVRKAINFLYRTQEPDGSWFGRWGVNYLYGTSHALRGLAAVGENLNTPPLLRAREWIESHQNPDGGWGESPHTYDDPSTRGQGPSTASQTAWAILALLSFPDPQRTSIQKGAEFLCRSQNPDGSWSEIPFTGTGFPGVFYLQYPSYRNNWPLLALNRFLRLNGASADAP